MDARRGSSFGKRRSFQGKRSCWLANGKSGPLSMRGGGSSSSREVERACAIKLRKNRLYLYSTHQVGASPSRTFNGHIAHCDL